MSLIEVVSDINNTFLSRREITCNFQGLGGRLNKLDAMDMISKEFGLDGKFTIPIHIHSHVGKPLLTGTFYVYDDEGLARRQVNPILFTRLDTARKKAAESAPAPADEAAGKEASDKPPAESAPAPADEAAGKEASDKETPTGDES